MIEKLVIRICFIEALLSTISSSNLLVFQFLLLSYFLFLILVLIIKVFFYNNHNRKKKGEGMFGRAKGWLLFTSFSFVLLMMVGFFWFTISASHHFCDLSFIIFLHSSFN